ncbi:hypothetical protein E2C01_071117 [Portunus trituberculatus]|uniref:Uncharacterized protein n=1 Tax=Portunus trituberculatus TaxID=210409 RepID=A0A5B7I361_PORTR|nr:hypothetical protein [Portunus trituberculatus]
MRPSEELPEHETAVGGPYGGESRPEDDAGQISSRGKGNHLLGRQWERAQAAVDGVPRPHADQSF